MFESRQTGEEGGFKKKIKRPTNQIVKVAWSVCMSEQLGNEVERQGKANKSTTPMYIATLVSALQTSFAFSTPPLTNYVLLMFIQ